MNLLYSSHQALNCEVEVLWNILVKRVIIILSGYFTKVNIKFELENILKCYPSFKVWFKQSHTKYPYTLFDVWAILFLVCFMWRSQVSWQSWPELGLLFMLTRLLQYSTGCYSTVQAATVQAAKGNGTGHYR